MQTESWKESENRLLAASAAPKLIAAAVVDAERGYVIGSVDGTFLSLQS